MSQTASPTPVDPDTAATQTSANPAAEAKTDPSPAAAPQASTSKAVDPRTSPDHASALLLPNRYRDQKVVCQRAMPGIVILVHGVNDVGVSFPALDNGLCVGLNERMHRNDLYPNDFTMPKAGDKAQDDPDAIYYRIRPNAKTYSPVIHFHWGYRAAKDEIAQETVFGQNVDNYGNRLDARKAREGGMFVNATTSIPDMFRGRFSNGVTVWLANKTQDVAHNLKGAPERHYMVLAALRLAALIKQIRLINPDDTVTLLGHSQGCLISLTAQAFLHEKGDRVADCLILCHPPYAVQQAPLESLQLGWDMQSTEARIETLQNLVQLVTGTPHRLPPFESMFHEHVDSCGVTGTEWSPSKGHRASSDAAPLTLDCEFDERDNRGKVYLYFCPHDRTVGLSNVEGIGTLGVPDEVLTRLGKRFFQRIWTWRLRGKTPVAVKVGLPPDPAFSPRQQDEPGYKETSVLGEIADVIMQKANDEGETRNINAEALNPPFTPNLHANEMDANQPVDKSATPTTSDPEAQGKLPIDPIDATDALVKAGLDGASDEKNARETYQKQGFGNSYHSAIVGNQEHHRWVTAMDVAIGPAKSIQDPDWLTLLSAIADWRSRFDPEKDIPKLKKYSELHPDVSKLAVATYAYYKDGKFPSDLVPPTPPEPVVDISLIDSWTPFGHSSTTSK